jgi:hypothetical protein
MTDSIKFKAEIKEVKSKKTASLDISYRIVLETDDPKILLLGSLGGDELVDVEVR